MDQKHAGEAKRVASKNQILATIAGSDENIMSIAILKSEIDTQRYPKIVFFFDSLCSVDGRERSIFRSPIIA